MLAGESDHDVVDMLRESMFATTVVGSPIENACRINQRHGPQSRRYYGSALAMLGRDEEGRDTPTRRSPFRMAEIGLDGRFEIGAGATIVRDSEPVSETAETSAKVRGMLAALGVSGSGNDPCYRLGEQVYNEDTMIQLAARNAKLCISGSKTKVICAMRMRNSKANASRLSITKTTLRACSRICCAHSSMIPKIVKNAAYDPATDDADLIVLGPGPGDPRDLSDPRIAKANNLCKMFVEQKKRCCAFVWGIRFCATRWVCLWRRRKDRFKAHRSLSTFGSPERVGFYNTFAGKVDGKQRDIEISFDEQTGEIHALRGKGFWGVQFHPESILTTNGMRIVHEVMRYLGAR